MEASAEYLAVISVMRNRFVKSYPDYGERVYSVDTAYGLLRAYSTDAHFTQYTSPLHRRLSSRSLADGAVAQMNVIVLDVDCGASHGGGGETPVSWREEMLRKMVAMSAVHPGAVYYETRGGSRIVYTLPKPVAISSREHALDWSMRYAVTVEYVRRMFGIDADTACGDWQRCFRLPRATRDGVEENRPIYGHPSNIGVLEFEPAQADIANASQRSQVFAPMRVHTLPTSGHGMYYYALRNRGHILREMRGGYAIVCPRQKYHSCGKPGDTSTILYAPAVGKTLGAIHCKHASCSGVRDWLGEFSGSEVDRANMEAGNETK